MQVPEFTFAANPQWNNLDAWREVQPNGSAVLLDPATGDRLDGFHQWLLADPRLKDGVDFILDQATAIDLTVVRGPHGAASKDPKARAAIAQSHVVGIEGLGAWTKDGPGPTEVDETSAHSKSAAADEARVPWFIYDASAESPLELDQLICRMGVLWDPRYLHHPDYAKRPLDRLEWFVASEALREPYIFARYGYELMRRWESFGGFTVKACLTIGQAHGNIPEMFGRAGVHATDVEELAPPLEGAASAIAKLMPLMINMRHIPSALRKAEQ
jgi:hypothetical protein